MRILRLRIEQLRKFRAPIEIGDFDDGLNLFVGLNEAGKSTIAAAIRAAFFERHRSGSVEALRPWGDSAASPSIEIDFTIGGHTARLRKRFLHQRRCELEIDGRKLDGADAEDHLAAMLGFGFPGRGESNARHWGIPGLLWIEQGMAQEIGDPVSHAADHLNRALGEALGAVAGGIGDAVRERVAAERNALLTASRGEPRGDYAQALARADALRREIETLEATLASYRGKVDRIAALRAEYDHEAAEQPWVAMRAQERKAIADLEAVERIQRELRTVEDGAQQLEKRHVLLRERLDTFAQEERDFAARSAACDTARTAQQSAQAAVASWQARREQAQAQVDAATAALTLARREDQRRASMGRVEELRAQLARGEETLRAAEAEQTALLAARRLSTETELREEDWQPLRDRHARLRELAIRQTAAATRVRYDITAGRSIRVGETECGGAGEVLIVASTVLTVPGVGRIEVAPGGADLAELRSELDALQVRQDAALRALGLASWEDAEARQRQYRGHLAECTTREATLRALAPKGIDVLRAALAESAIRLRQEESILAAFPPPADAAADRPSIVQAESAEGRARAERDAVTEQWNQAGFAAANAQAALDAAEREHRDLRSRLDAPDRAERLRKAQDEWHDVNTERAALARKIETLRQAIDAARPELLAQDAARYRASAEAAERAQSERRFQIGMLESELATLGAQGLDERHADLVGEHEQAARHAAGLRRRAAALDHLLEMLDARRAAVAQRLRAPLQRHLDRTVRMLFPQAALELGEDFAPRLLVRPGMAPEAGSAEFASLSFGAREQMGVISRLAYADLLKEAGRPTLILLDDALVHSDAARLDRMKRVLFDAATRHQILLFSCHPENWRDLGVRPRLVEDLAASAPTGVPARGAGEIP